MVKPYRRTVPRDEEMFMATAARPSRRAGRDRTEVLRAAGEVIAARGVEATRFSDVSVASGVPVSTLQYYFGNREDMIVAALRHVGAEEIALLQRTLEETGHLSSWQQLVGLIRVGVAQDSTRPAHTWRLWVELWRSALRDDELRSDALDVAARWRGLLVAVIARGQRAGEFRGDVSAATVAHQTMCLMDGVGIPAALGDPDLTSPLALVTEAVAALLGVDAEPPRTD
jgi:AcrR family transcriptional regulator